MRDSCPSLFVRLGGRSWWDGQFGLLEGVCMCLCVIRLKGIPVFYLHWIAPPLPWPLKLHAHRLDFLDLFQVGLCDSGVGVLRFDYCNIKAVLSLGFAWCHIPLSTTPGPTAGVFRAGFFYEGLDSIFALPASKSVCWRCFLLYFTPLPSIPATLRK